MKRPLSYNNPARIFLGSFLLLIFVGTILLMLPVSAASKSLSFIDALFMSTSSVCVTGLSTVDAPSQLSTFGQVVMMFLIQIG
ncbi:MAG TPA: potassium transporter TrkG, partial [Candidatus Aminicenantes bacterium]|nr:potassium transporter TrkG [Candidatus Aminicenantes bacterium]HPS98992.1 potassium transporter TrkG [Candidatus Aminicenantes bacterium]